MDVGSDTPTWKINASVCSSVVNKDLTLKAKANAKDLTFKAKAKGLTLKAKAKAKDLTFKAKAKDLNLKAKDLTSEQVEGPL